MKKAIMPLAVVIAAVSFTACGGSNSGETGTDSISAVSSETSTENAGTSTISTTDYVDLSTGSEVTLEKDPQTGFYMNTETRKPVDFYIDRQTSDTFDMRGRVVNMAIIRDAAGKFTIDESKVKLQGDGDLIIKDQQNDTKVKLETNGDTKVKTEDYKEKTKGDDYKYKDDSTTIKVKDGKVKVKKS